MRAVAARSGALYLRAESIESGDFSVRARQGYRAPEEEKAEEKDREKKSGN